MYGIPFSSFTNLRIARVSTLYVCVATGYGRVSVPYADKMITEITCHAMGAVWIFDNKDMKSLISVDRIQRLSV